MAKAKTTTAGGTCDLDATVHVIQFKAGNLDIINQYIMFCRVFNQQLKLYGYSEKKHPRDAQHLQQRRHPR